MGDLPSFPVLLMILNKVKMMPKLKYYRTWYVCVHTLVWLCVSVPTLTHDVHVNPLLASGKWKRMKRKTETES